ncbi:MAG: hypothetical protein ACT4OK_04175 [Gemmobacter sp.]
MLYRLYRERRRFLIVALAFALAGLIAFWDDPRTVGGVPMPLVAMLAFATGLTLFLGTIVLAFPVLRWNAEGVALSMPLLALMDVIETMNDGLLSFGGAQVFFVVYLVVIVYTGPWLDRLLPLRQVTSETTTTSHLPPDRLWPHWIISPDTIDAYPQADILSVRWLEPGRTMHMVARSGDLATVEEVQTIRHSERPHAHAFDWTAPTARPGAVGISGSVDIALRPAARGTRVTTRRRFDNSNWAHQVRVWIDDSFGRIDDGDARAAERAEAARAAA